MPHDHRRHVHGKFVHVADRLHELAVHFPIERSVVGMQDKPEVPALPIGCIDVLVVNGLQHFRQAASVANKYLGSVGVDVDFDYPGYDHQFGEFVIVDLLLSTG